MKGVTVPDEVLQGEAHQSHKLGEDFTLLVKSQSLVDNPSVRFHACWLIRVADRSVAFSGCYQDPRLAVRDATARAERIRSKEADPEKTPHTVESGRVTSHPSEGEEKEPKHKRGHK